MNTESISKHKSFSQPNQKKKHNQAVDSITKVCLPFTDLMAGEHTHLSFDCPKTLRKAFKLAVKANGSSICHVLQTFMVTYLVSNHYQKAYFNNTMRAPIVVENLVVPSYVKRRVRRMREEVVEEFEYNYYSSEGEWFYRDVPASKLNEYGHVKGCCCKLCRVVRRR